MTRGMTAGRSSAALRFFLSIAIPVVFIALVDYHRQSTGIDWLGAVGALVALSLIVAITAVTARR